MNKMEALVIVLLAIGLAENPGCVGVKQIQSTFGNGFDPEKYFARNQWELDKDQLIGQYSRNFRGHGQFAFIVRSPTDPYVAELTLAEIRNDERLKTCREQFARDLGSKPIYKKLVVGEGTDRSDKVLVQYVAEDDYIYGGYTETTIDMTNCGETFKRTSEITAPRERVDRNNTDKPNELAPSLTDKLEPATINGTDGFIYTREVNGSEPQAKIIFTSLPSGETSELGTVDLAAHYADKVWSYANAKYGLCSIEDTDVICIQKDTLFKVLMNYTHMELPEPVDWFHAYNLKEPAMLVLAGKCPNNECSEMNIWKLEENNKVSEHITIEGLRLGCYYPKEHLTIDIVVEPENDKVLCLNLVCTSLSPDRLVRIQHNEHCIQAYI